MRLNSPIAAPGLALARSCLTRARSRALQPHHCTSTALSTAVAVVRCLLKKSSEHHLICSLQLSVGAPLTERCFAPSKTAAETLWLLKAEWVAAAVAAAKFAPNRLLRAPSFSALPLCYVCGYLSPSKLVGALQAALLDEPATTAIATIAVQTTHLALPGASTAQTMMCGGGSPHQWPPLIGPTAVAVVVGAFVQ